MARLTDEQWAAIRARVNEYAMCVTDAANHQSASKADIARSAALSALQGVRRAIEAGTQPPADVLKAAQEFVGNDYRGPLPWARKVFDWVAGLDAPSSRGTPT